MQKKKYLIYNKQADYTSVCLKQPLLKDLFDLFLFFLTTPSIVYCGISQFVIYFFFREVEKLKEKNFHRFSKQ